MNDQEQIMADNKQAIYDVTRIEDRQQGIASPAPATPADIVLYAMKNGGSIAEIREFMQLQREWEADQARKAFVADMAEFKKNPPTIVKDKEVSFKAGSGTTSYSHATLGNVTSAIVDGLAKHGFSHRWDTKQEAGRIIVTCLLTHKLGFSESTTLESGAETSGTKNAIQAMGSAITYLQRYTLLAATGLATHDQDDDGNNFGTADTTLADNWIAKVKAAPTDADVVKVWEVGIEAIGKSGDKHAATEFKAAVAERRADFATAAKGAK